MNFESLKINEKLSVKYTVQKNINQSKVLAVSFPGGGGGYHDELGYIFTLKKFNCYGLFFKAEQDVIKSLFCFYNRTTVIEEKIWDFICKISKELGCERVIFVGSSLGGYCALYYGIKYNCDIISGSPMIYTTELPYVEFCSGGKTESDIEWLYHQLNNIVKVNSHFFNKRLFVSFGSGESNWLKHNAGKDFCKLLDSFDIKYTLKLFPFKNHNSIHRLFPQVLDYIFPQYFSSEVTNTSTLDFLETHSDISVINNFQSRINDIASILQQQKNELYDFEKLPNVDYDVIFYKKNVEEELKDYCYINSGYYLKREGKKNFLAKNIHSCGGFWSVDSVAIDEYLGFQSCLYDLYIRTKDEQVIGWLNTNMTQFFSIYKYYKKGKRNISSLLTRFFFLFNTLNVANSCFYPLFKYRKCILEILRNDLLLALSEPIFNIPVLPYYVIRSVLCYSLVIKQFETVFNDVFDKIFVFLNDLNKYNFNQDGICVLGLSVHEQISLQLHYCLDFLCSCGFDSSMHFNRLSGFVKKIDVVNSHIVKPNNTLVSIGHTAPVKTELVDYVSRRVSNYIKTSSDLVILEDENSYISIGSGNPYKSKYRHSDLMSFSWFFNHYSILENAGCGERDELFTYSCSSFAHNCFFCEDVDYVVPSFMDFTTFEYCKEYDDHVVISMKHELIENSCFCRKLVWIKPNIIILIDQAESSIEHKYIQNFLLENYHYKVVSDYEVLVNINDDNFLKIKNYSISGIKPKLLVIDGKHNEKEKFLGMIINDSKKSVRQGLNISYRQKSNKCFFLTSLYIDQSPSNDLEVSLDQDTLKVTQNDIEKVISLS